MKLIPKYKIGSVVSSMRRQRDKESDVASEQILPEVEVVGYRPYTRYQADTITNNYSGLLDPLDRKIERFRGNQELTQRYETEGSESAAQKQAEYRATNKEVAKFLGLEGLIFGTGIFGTIPKGILYDTANLGNLGYQFVRNPLYYTKNFIYGIKDIPWNIQNPDAITVYHGTKKPFVLKEAVPYSKDNVGLHVTPIKGIAESFKRKHNGTILEAKIPNRVDMETMDLGNNNYSLLDNNIIKGFRDPEISVPEAAFTHNLLYKYGGNPTLYKTANPRQINISLERPVKIPLQQESWPDMPIQVRQQADKIIKQSSPFYNTGETPAVKATRLNQEATTLFSNNGKKIIKYINEMPSEGGGGLSYMITDPSELHIPVQIIGEQITPLRIPILMSNVQDN